MRSLSQVAVAVVAVSAFSSALLGDTFRPDAATAGSEFSGLYDIGNAIDGSGLPARWTIFSLHANYTTNNHWTTKAGALQAGNAWASFTFNTDRTVGTFHLWNHRSNGIASDPGYAVTLFELRMYDAANELLFVLPNQTALPNLAEAQHFCWEPVSGVRRVDLKIIQNNGSPNYTGVAEVAFSSEGRDTSQGDLNCDTIVNGLDLAILLGVWGPCEGCPRATCNADINGDCVVDAADLALLLGGWTG
ncbi:MAG: dockerin type I repeat-containing protein [Phycisphaerae bacterium]|nr:dockerin type I repeat-containing protein [Phycisphaerae bacterium]